MSELAPPTHVVPIPEGQCTANVTPKWFVDKSEYHPHLATYRPLVNGEEAFGEVYRAINAAKESVCIICWGFQPSMHFIRTGTQPPLGELLIKKAQKGVVVRVLSWACNLAGDIPVTGAVLGESNLPGRWRPGFYGDKPKTATYSQYLYDVLWFALFDRQRGTGLTTNPLVKELAKLAERKLLPELHKARKNLRFYSRSYSVKDMASNAGIEYFDKELSLTTKATLTFTPSHHQKMVMVDHENPKRAIGFVMGHNMLDFYWDTSDHSGKQQRADCGRNGASPLHDYSSRVTGPIIGDLFHNFSHAWLNETWELLPKPDFPNFPLLGNDAQTVCQILRTQPQTNPKRADIAKCYLQAVSNATQYIAIENQYFRWPTLAAKIQEAAAKMTAWGRCPEKHGFLYLFVISNTSDTGIGAGTVNTYRMLEALGRADRLPEVARHERGKSLDRDSKAAEMELKAAEKALDENANRQNSLLRERKALDNIASFVTRNLSDRYAAINKKLAELQAERRQLEERKRRIEARMREIEERKARLQPPADSKRKPEAIVPRDVPGLKVHISTLVAPDTQDGEEWQEVYIHAKLMMIDDTFMTMGSANINTRSMQIDSELNIAHHRPETTGPLREQQWDKYTRGKGDTKGRIPPGTPLKEAFAVWDSLMKDNAKAKGDKAHPVAQLAEFLRTSDAISDKD